MAIVISVRRIFLAGIALLFGAFNVALALLRLDRYNDTALIVLVGLVYFAALVVSTVAFRKLQLPMPVSTSVAAVGLAIPIFSHLALDSGSLEMYDTWYVTAVGLLFAVLAVRGRALTAIIAGSLFCVEVLYFGGLSYFPKSGISGAVILIVACIAVSKGLDASAKEISEAQAKTLAEKTDQQSSITKADAISYAVNVAMKSTVPTLKRVASGKNFSAADRAKYEDLSVRLRDDISGGWLMTNKVRKSVAAARARGVDVALLDDGGIETIGQSELDELLDLVCSALSGINIGRVTIRTQPQEAWLIRMTASRPGVVTPDLDLKLGER